MHTDHVYQALLSKLYDMPPADAVVHINTIRDNARRTGYITDVQKQVLRACNKYQGIKGDIGGMEALQLPKPVQKPKQDIKPPVINYVNGEQVVILKAQIADLRKQGMTLVNIAATLNVPVSIIKRHCPQEYRGRVVFGNKWVGKQPLLPQVTMIAFAQLCLDAFPSYG